MSLIFAALPRSDRLLPVESEQTLRSAALYRVRFLDRVRDAELHEHVSFYAAAHAEATARPRRRARLVGLTRTPVRRGAFPCVQHSSSDGDDEDDGRDDNNNNNSNKRRDADMTRRSLRPCVWPVWWPLAWRAHVRLLAPYETLLCPGLLCSPLLPPLLLEQQQPQQPQPWSPHVSAPCGGAHDSRHDMHSVSSSSPSWSMYVRGLSTIATVATQLSLPLHEALLFVSMSIVYLDLTMTRAMYASTTRCPSVACECHARANSRTKDNNNNSKCSHDTVDDDHDDRDDNVVSSMHELQQRLQRCLARYAHCACSTTSTTMTTTAVAACRHNAALRLLLLAAHEWQQRRAATVSASRPLGCCAVALAPRDLLSTAAMTTAAPTATATTTDADAMCASVTTATTTTTAARTAATTRRQPQQQQQQHGSVFQPYHARTTPSHAHAFVLPPLPCDVQHVAFVHVWQRVLRTCIAEREHALCRLRDVALQTITARCAELVHANEARRRRWQQQQQQQQQQQHGVCAAAATTTTRVHALPLLSSLPLSTSFALYGLHSGQWQCNKPLAWRGFVGMLLRCGVWDSAEAQAQLQQYAQSHEQHHHHQPHLQLLTGRHGNHNNDSDNASSAADFWRCLLRRFDDGVQSLHASAMHASGVELADWMCRLALSLQPSSTTPLHHDHIATTTTTSSSLVLTRPQAAFVLRVLQRERVDVYLQCRQQGLQEIHLRTTRRGVAGGGGGGVDVSSTYTNNNSNNSGGGAATTVALTFVQECGREVLLCTAAQLASAAYAVMPSPSSATAATHAQSVRHDGSVVVDAMDAYGIADVGYAEACELTACLRRQPGRTVRNIPLYMHGNNNNNNDNNNSTSERVPMVRALLLHRTEEAVLLRILQCHPHAVYVVGCGVRQLLVRQSDGQTLLQRSCGVVVEWDMRACYRYERVTSTRRTRDDDDDGSSRSSSSSSRSSSRDSSRRSERASSDDDDDDNEHDTDHDVERMAIQQQRRRQQQAQWVLRSPRRSVAAPAYGPALPLPVDVPHAAQRVRWQAVCGMLAHYHKALVAQQQQQQARDANGTTTSSSSASLSLPLRTTLYPVDRAVARYVLRHHPRYYTHVRGCGIAEVYVGEDSSSSSSNNNNNNDNDDNNNTSAAATVDEAAAQHSRAVLIVERVCGRTVEVDLRACYTCAAPHVLLPYQILASCDTGHSDEHNHNSNSNHNSSSSGTYTSNSNHDNGDGGRHDAAVTAAPSRPSDDSAVTPPVARPHKRLRLA